MTTIRRPEQEVSDDGLFYSQEWEHDTGPTSTLFPSAPSTVAATDKTTSQMKRKPVEVTQYDGASVSLMEEDISSPAATVTSEPKVAHFRRTLFRSWLWEILSCLVAIASLVAFAVILKIYDGSALSEWTHTITINSILSILITVIKAMVVVPLAEGLSQLKWSWFEEKERSLNDLVTFDEASRGILGASKLVIRVKPWHLASIGSALFLASFAVGPFAQQVVQIGTREIRTFQNASVPICISSDSTYKDSVYAQLANEKTTLSTIGSIYEGIFKPFTTPRPVEVVCPSGNCTFPAYQTLGICHKCADVTEYLSATSLAVNKTTVAECAKTGNCNYQLPNNSSLQMRDLYSSMVNSINTLEFKPLPIIHPSLASKPDSFLHFTSIQSLGFSAGPASAAECIMYYCVREYVGAATAGTFSESSKEIPSKATGKDGKEANFFGGIPVVVTPEYCMQNGTRKNPPYQDGDGCVSKFGGQMGNALLNTIKPLVTGSVRRTGGMYTWSSDTIEAGYNEHDPAAIYNVFGNLSSVLTDHLRTSDDICGGSSPGIVFRSESYMFVVWWWMIYPIFVVAATTMFLVLIMIKTRHQHIWKSSPLALVFSGLYQGSHMQAARILRGKDGPEVSTMENAAMGMKARLRREGEWDVRHTGRERQDVGSEMEKVWLWRRVGKWTK